MKLQISLLQCAEASDISNSILCTQKSRYLRQMKSVTSLHHDHVLRLRPGRTRTGETALPCKLQLESRGVRSESVVTRRGLAAAAPPGPAAPQPRQPGRAAAGGPRRPGDLSRGLQSSLAGRYQETNASVIRYRQTCTQPARHRAVTGRPGPARARTGDCHWQRHRDTMTVTRTVPHWQVGLRAPSVTVAPSQ